MKHLKAVENKMSESTLYRYTVGALYFVSQKLKTGFIWSIHHITELLITITMIGMIIVGEALHCGAISGIVAVLFILVLGVLALALIKIKVMECKRK